MIDIITAQIVEIENYNRANPETASGGGLVVLFLLATLGLLTAIRLMLPVKPDS